MGTSIGYAPGTRRRWPLRRLGLALWLLALALLAPNLGGGTEFVRIRHALLLGPEWVESEDWKPPARPADFRVESHALDARLVAVVRKLELDALPDDWARAKVLGRHLLASAPQLVGGAVQADLWGTHQSIVQRGEGYCGDFVRVYLALANAAGLTLRPWAFSFDGFGGHGHIWVELWNRQAERWQLIDVFDNFYFVRRGEETPISALEFRRELLSAGGAAERRRIDLRLLVPEARPGYEIEAKAWAYFERGLHQWYLPFGSNVHSVDAAPVVRLFSGWSRMGEGVGALVSGRSPVVRVLASEANAGARADLRAVRLRAWAALACGVLGVLILLGAPWLAPRASRQERMARAAHQGWPHVCLVGPLPPPSGGMANQCEQLLRLLREERASVTLVRTNAPYRPAWVGRVPMLRAFFRLAPYLWTLWRAIGRAHVVHVFANSGWAWYLLAQPALWVGRMRRVPVIVNYRGGQADEFFARAPRWVLGSLQRAALRVTPSPFLRRVFAQHGLKAEIIPNIIDLQRFKPREPRAPGSAPHLIVTRNLEPIYDIPTALRAFAAVRAQHGGARLTVAGSGPQQAELEQMVADMGLTGAVTFSGRIDNERIGALYADADVVLNPSTADNMPISILEALASGVPVVTTSAGGIPDMVQDGVTALIVPVGDAQAMASATLRVLADPALAWRLRAAGVRDAARYAWPQVRMRWQQAYRAVLAPEPATATASS